MDEATMFQVSAGVLGALAAVVLPLGAVQFAGDLAGGNDVAATVVNRAHKADRGIVQLSHREGRTVSIRLESLPDTSIVLRIPENFRLEAGDRVMKRDAMKPNSGRVPATQVRRTIACEPVVSTLTDIARQLQPGRCVT
jgi:hypothetical protein